MSEVFEIQQHQRARQTVTGILECALGGKAVGKPGQAVMGGLIDQVPLTSLDVIAHHCQGICQYGELRRSTFNWWGILTLANQAGKFHQGMDRAGETAGQPGRHQQRQRQCAGENRQHAVAQVFVILLPLQV